MSFTAIDGYAVVAEMRYGVNGSFLGTPEIAIGSSPEDQATERYQWDADTSDGFDSGWISLELEVVATASGARMTWCVNSVEIAFDGPQCDEVLGFIFRGGVCASDSCASFRNVSAQFFSSSSATSPTQTVFVDDASADTTNDRAPDAEAIVTLAPDGGGFQKARLFAQVRIQSQSVPAPDDLFNQAFVFTC